MKLLQGATTACSCEQSWNARHKNADKQSDEEPWLLEASPHPIKALSVN